MSRDNGLAKNTIIITIGRISTQFVAFLLLPLYTALLSKGEYGGVELIITIVQLFIPIVSLMIDQGAFRYLLNSKNDYERKKVVSNAFFIATIMNITFILIYAITTRFVKGQYTIWIILILIVTVYNNLLLQVARGFKKVPAYALGSFVCAASTIVLNVVLIVFFRIGAVGMLIATFSGNLVCFIFLIQKLRILKYLSFKSLDKTVAYEELKYSIPLVPNQLSLWVMNSSDRLIVSWTIGTAANGVLSVSHKFPAIYMTFFNIFLLAWHETGAIHYYDDDRDQFFTNMLSKLLTIFSILCMGIIVVLPFFFHHFVNQSYYEAYYSIPIYLVASLFNVVIGILGVVYVATKKTLEIAKTTFIAAIINILINFMLIHRIGLYAASISTFIGYLIVMIYRIIDMKKYINIKYDIRQCIIITFSLLICSIIYYINNKLISCFFLPAFVVLVLRINKGTLRFAKKYIEKILVKYE